MEKAMNFIDILKITNITEFKRVIDYTIQEEE